MEMDVGYLTRVEANLVGVRPAPGVVFVRLTRDFDGEGRKSHMFIELSPGEALGVIRHLKDAVGVALGVVTPA